jgi:hypothetical protein
MDNLSSIFILGNQEKKYTYTIHANGRWRNDFLFKKNTLNYQSNKIYIMNISEDYSTYFTVEENEWLNENEDTKEQLFEEIEDISNVNPLDNGEPDLGPLKSAIKATKLVITVSKNNILEGPYNTSHLQLIKSTFPEIKLSAQKFWECFSFFCSCKRDEDITNKQRIYIGAITEIILSETLEDDDLQGGSPSGIYNLDTDEIEYIKGEGVNARM